MNVRSQHNDPHPNLVFNFLKSQGEFYSKSYGLAIKTQKLLDCNMLRDRSILNCHYQKVFPSTVSSFVNLSHKKAASLQ